MATFVGTNGNDRIRPTGVSAGVNANPIGSRPGDGTDIIFGIGGNNTLDGGGGRDSIIGGVDRDTIYGGDGADYIHGNDGDDLIYNDRSAALADTAPDTVRGGNGDDVIYAYGVGVFYGNADDDLFHVTPSLISGTQTIDGGSGIDTISFSSTHIFETINLETGESSVPNLMFRNIENVHGNYLANTMTGDANGNLIWGLDGRDTIDGGAGDDSLNGDGGIDLIFGGSGEDTISGGGNNDTIFGDRPGVLSLDLKTVWGGEGNDILISSGRGSYSGQEGNDYFVYATGYLGRPGYQNFQGGVGSDTLDLHTRTRDTTINLGANTGNVADLSFWDVENVIIGDQLNGGRDLVYGSGADNRIASSGGNDTIYGYGGNDDLLGGRDNDTLRGGSGGDTLKGDHGSDWIEGGLDADELDGGYGNDWFVFRRVEDSQGWDYDTIVDFEGAGEVGGDIIYLRSIDADLTRDGNQAFRFLGDVSDSVGLSYGAGYLWTVNTGANTYVRGNVDDDRFLELTILIEDGADATAATYFAQDFSL